MGELCEAMVVMVMVGEAMVVMSEACVSGPHAFRLPRRPRRPNGLPRPSSLPAHVLFARTRGVPIAPPSGVPWPPHGSRPQSLHRGRPMLHGAMASPWGRLPLPLHGASPRPLHGDVPSEGLCMGRPHGSSMGRTAGRPLTAPRGGGTFIRLDLRGSLGIQDLCPCGLNF